MRVQNSIGHEIFKGFEIKPIRRQSDSSIVSRVVGYRATLPAWPSKGRPSDIVIEGGLREIKKQIKDFWAVDQDDRCSSDPMGSGSIPKVWP